MSILCTLFCVCSTIISTMDILSSRNSTRTHDNEEVDTAFGTTITGVDYTNSTPHCIDDLHDIGRRASKQQRNFPRVKKNKLQRNWRGSIWYHSLLVNNAK